MRLVGVVLALGLAQAAYAQPPAVPAEVQAVIDELAQIAELCQEFDVLAITDEVYDRLLYAGAEHVPLATLPKA